MQESTGLGLDRTTLSALYAAGATTPSEVVRIVYRRIPEYLSNPIWITLRREEDVLGEALALEARGPERGPLYGLPFAVKDNLDCAGLPTTAACPALAYTPAKSAHAVRRLVNAGALLIGKTNLDQLATGLTAPARPMGLAATSSMTVTSPGDRAVARRSRWPRVSRASRSAPTPPARAGCRRRSTTSWA